MTTRRRIRTTRQRPPDHRLKTGRLSPHRSHPRAAAPWFTERTHEGNRTKKTEISSGDYVEYTWDHRNRLTTVTFRDSSDVKTKEVAYTYDMFNRRIAKDVDDDGDGTDDRGERYVYDGAHIVLVFDEADTLIERILHGPGVDQPLASENASGDVAWLLADNQGSIRDVAEYDAGTDATTVINHLTYGGFGNIVSQTSSSDEPRFTYTGREWDADAELFFYRARWYDANVGRFISEDPLGFGGQDANLSRYVGNGSVNFNDASGLQRTTINPRPLYLHERPDMMATMYIAGGPGFQGDWLDYSANIAAGFGDGISSGITDHIRNGLGINDGIQHDTGVYTTSYYGGTAYSFLLGVGAAGNAARGGGWAVRALQGYTVGGDIYGVGQSSYHLYTGDFQAQDALGFVPMLGYSSASLA